LAELPSIAFAGTPAFAVPTLERLCGGGANVTVVLTQPDRPAGRGRKLAASPVKHAAQTLGLSIAQPASLRDPTLLARLGPRPELLVVVAYGLLLPQWMLDWPLIAPLNLHASLLPRWRGAAPIQHAILAGDRSTGVSLMRIVRALDSGPVYAAAEVEISTCETAGELQDRLAGTAADLLAAQLRAVLGGSIEAVAQDERRATYAPKIGKADAVLDWREPAAALERRVRAFNPWPVAEARTDDGHRLRIWRAQALPGDARAMPGAVLAGSPDGIDVATGEGRLRLKVVQPPGARAMDAAAYLAAHRVDGTSFAI
jgi:methionyl-tRNA formyltransferase